MDEQRWLTFDLFEDRVGEEFVVSTDDGSTIRTELVEATESAEPGGPGPDGLERRQFSLVFRGPVDPLLPQATYAVEHGDLGHLDVFLVPIGRAAEGARYQAVFA